MEELWYKIRPHYNRGCLVVAEYHSNQKGPVADPDDDPDPDEESEGSMPDADMPHLLEDAEEDEPRRLDLVDDESDDGAPEEEVHH